MSVIAMTDQEVKDYYSSVQKEFKKQNQIKGLAVDFSAYIKNPSCLGHARKFLYSDGCDGKLWPETIDTACKFVKLISENKNIGLFGLVQSAKTPTQIIGTIISSIFKHLRDGVWSHPCFFTPAMKGSYCAQFEKKFEQLFQCIKEVKIVYNGKSTTIDRYLEDAKHERGEAMKTLTKYNRKKAFFNTKVMVEQKRVIILPFSKKYAEVLPAFFTAFFKAGHHVIIDRDEAHSAVGEDSVNDRILEHKISDEFTDVEKSIYSMIDGQNAQFVAVSATNWAALHLHKLYLTVNENYTGLDFGFHDSEGNKHLVAGDQNVKIKTPEFQSLREFAKDMKNNSIPWLNSNWYSNENQFEKYQSKHDLKQFKDWYDYRKQCQHSIAAIIVRLLVSKNFKNHRGLLLRFINNNKVMKEIIENIRPILDKHKIKIIEEFGGEEINVTITDLLRNRDVKDNDLYVVIATAGARMSDTFPAHCGYAVDLTNKSGLAALIQGCLGRMSGYYKDPFILLSDSNTNILNGYIENGFCPVRGKIMPGVKVRGQGTYVSFTEDHYNDANFKEFRRRFQNIIGDIETSTNKFGELIMRLGKAFPVCFFDILKSDGMRYCAENAQQRLLEKHEVDQNNRSYMIHNNRVVMTIRREGCKKGGRPSESNKQEGTEKLRPIIRIEVLKKNKLRVVGWDIPIFQAKNTISHKTVPGKVAALC